MEYASQFHPNAVWLRDSSSALANGWERPRFNAVWNPGLLVDRGALTRGAPRVPSNRFGGTMQVPASRAAAFYGFQGMGDLSPSVRNLVIQSPSIAAGVLTAPAIGLVTPAMWGGLAIPVIGAAVVGVTIGLTALMSRKGPKQKVATTEVVDTAEPIMAENRDGYLNGPRTVESRLQAIENFKALWQWVVDHCDIPEMGNPGQACVNDRKPGGKWDWWSYYYDPIYNDVPVGSGASDAAASTAYGPSTAASVTEVFTPGSDGSLLGGQVLGFPVPLALAGAAAFLFMMMPDDAATGRRGRR